MTETDIPLDVEEMQRVVNGCLRIHAPTIAVIGFSGDVAVALYEPSERSRARARAIGWDGTSDVFRLTAEGKKALARSTEPSDSGIAKWLGKKFEPAAPVARIYVLAGDDSILMNFSPFGGWSREPAATGDAGQRS